MSDVGLSRARARLLDTDTVDLPTGRVCEEIVRAFHEVASFEWCAVMTTDPETFLPSGGVVEGFSPQACVPFWDNELLDADFNKFTELARSVDPVATLLDSVDGVLERSPRYQKLYAPLEAADELRVAFVSGSSCFGVGVFLRAADQGPFTAEEVAEARALLPGATTALRRALGRILTDASTQPPIVIMLDGEGSVTGMTAGGREVLEDLRVNIDGDFPGLLQVAATKARFSRASTSLTTRLRGRSGRWLRLHVTPMEDEHGGVALTVETARPDDLVRILLDSYGLTPRETEIVLRLCRGMTSKEIAAELFISVHTVRDHVKVIYEKAEVSSRAELVARLFSNHVLDRFHGTVAHVARAS